jgi:hypothetical protein
LTKDTDTSLRDAEDDAPALALRSPVHSLQFVLLLGIALAFLIPAIGLYLYQGGSAQARARAALEGDLTRYGEVLSAALRAPLWELSRSNT